VTATAKVRHAGVDRDNGKSNSNLFYFSFYNTDSSINRMAWIAGVAGGIGGHICSQLVVAAVASGSIGRYFVVANLLFGGSGFELLLGLYNEGEMVAKGCRSLQQQTTTIATVVLL
jgi:hypothetical protein